jgi:hypothetical protein
MDRLSKIRAGWRIATSGNSLGSKMRTLVFLYAHYMTLSAELQKEVSKAGEIPYLKALDELVKEQINES